MNEEAIRRREEERRKRDERGITYDSRLKSKDDRDYFEREWRPRGIGGRAEEKSRDRYDRRERDERSSRESRDSRERSDRRDRDRDHGGDDREKERRGGDRDKERRGDSGGRLREKDGRRENDWEQETPRSMHYEDEKLTPLIRQVGIKKIINLI